MTDGMPIRCLIAAALIGLARPGAAAEDGLMAWWRFDEGSGDVLHDRSGRGNHGKIMGAQWVRHGRGHALAFDGVDDRVDCDADPSLDLREAMTLLAWVYIDYGAGDTGPGIIGKRYESYFIQQAKRRIYTYAGHGSRNASARVAYGQWYHVASAYDGQVLRLYLGGEAVGERMSSGKIPSGRRHFWMGHKAASSHPDDFPTEAAYFKGKLTEVRVYDRALDAGQIREHYRTTKVTDAPELSVITAGWRKEVVAQVRRVGAETVAVDMVVEQGDRQLLRGRAEEFDGQGNATIYLDAANLESGHYRVVATARNAANESVGVPSRDRFTWHAQHYPHGPKGVRRLNNLVTELLNVSDGPRSHRFDHARDGWVYIANEGTTEVRLQRDGEGQFGAIPLLERHGSTREALRRLPAGRYAIEADTVRNLVVRAVPELVFAHYSDQPLMPQFGPYQGTFHEEHVFKNTTTFIGATEPFRIKWRKRGGRWFDRCHVPKRGPDGKAITVEEATKYITTHRGFRAAHTDGLLADEFGDSVPICRTYVDVLDRVYAVPASTGKKYWAYTGNLAAGPAGRELTRSVMKHDGAIIWKRYLPEPATTLAAVRSLYADLVVPGRGWRGNVPGSPSYITVCFGYFITPQIQLDTRPHVNYKTWLDMQFHVVANDPAFEGFGGLMCYNSKRADRETVRWGTRLLRHYGIEGRTEMLGDDPLILKHLDNPDFEQQGRGWELKPAEPDGIAFRMIRGFGDRQNRYPPPAPGDHVLMTRRSARAPNVFSQPIGNLMPGRVYNLRMFTCDPHERRNSDVLACSIQLDRVKLIPEQCFTCVPAKKEFKALVTYHWRVFRAESETARLTVSDWASDDKPGGPIGQEMAFNFIQIQPYQP